MQYKPGKTDAKLKPYSRRRCALTHSNCAISVSKQVQLYGVQAVKQGLKAVHVFPGTVAGTHSQVTRGSLAQRGLKLVDVNPEDWKCG